MGFMDKMGNSELKERKKFSINPMLSFSIIFIVLNIIFFMPNPAIQYSYTNNFKNIIQNYTKKYINSNKENKKAFLVKIIEEKKNKWILEITFVNWGMMNKEGLCPTNIYKLSVYDFCYVPTMFLISLILASPIRIRRKIFSLIIGLIVIHLFIIFRLLINIFDNYDPNFDLISMSNFFRDFFHNANNIINKNTNVGATIVIVIIIWLSVTFNLKDVDILLGKLKINLPQKKSTISPKKQVH